MKIRVPLVLAGALALAVSATAHQRTAAAHARPAAKQFVPAWMPFTSPGGLFTIQLPGPPQQRTQQIPTAVGRIQMYTFMYEYMGGQRAMMVSYNDYPAAIVRASDPNAMLDGARNGAVSNVNGTLLSEQRITIGRWPGRELMISVPRGNMVVRARLFLVRNRLYQALAIGPAAMPAEIDNMRFLNSFQLLVP